jgi:hypothetical protein
MLIVAFILISLQCHMQVLLSREAGEQVLRQFENRRGRNNSGVAHSEALPWNLLFKICKYYFVKPAQDVAEFKESLVTRADGLPDAVIVPIRVSSSEQHTRIVNSLNGITPLSFFGWTSRLLLPGTGRQATVFIVGDASMTAFYRLGIGINSVFPAIREFGNTLDKMMSFTTAGIDIFEAKEAAKLRTITMEHEKKTQNRVSKLVQYQQSTMFYGKIGAVSFTA